MSHFEHKFSQHNKSPVRTADEARRALEFSGVSISAWAKAFGFRPSTVAAVLRGDRPSRIGKSHQIAVALGIKSGCVVDDPKRV